MVVARNNILKKVSVCRNFEVNGFRRCHWAAGEDPFKSLPGMEQIFRHGQFDRLAI